MHRGTHKRREAVARDDGWLRKARCIGYPDDYMFPDYSAIDKAMIGNVGSCHKERRGKAVCFHCSVREECLRYCLELEPEFGPQYGIWGGTTERERHAARGWEDMSQRVAFLMHSSLVGARREGVVAA